MFRGSSFPTESVIPIVSVLTVGINWPGEIYKWLGGSWDEQSRRILDVHHWRTRKPTRDLGLGILQKEAPLMPSWTGAAGSTSAITRIFRDRKGPGRGAEINTGNISAKTGGGR